MTAPDDTPSGSEGSLADGHSPGRFITYALRAAGMVLVALVLLPVYRLLDGPDAGRFPRGSLAAAQLSRSMLFLGSFIAIAVAILASRVLDPSAIDRALGRLGKRLVAIPALWFAGGLALIAATLTLAFSLAVLDGKPNLILPGIGEDGPMFVRDMGPKANARLIQKYPDRVPTVLLRPRDGEPPKVVPYAEGMNLLWPIR